MRFRTEWIVNYPSCHRKGWQKRVILRISDVVYCDRLKIILLNKTVDNLLWGIYDLPFPTQNKLLILGRRTMVVFNLKCLFSRSIAVFGHNTPSPVKGYLPSLRNLYDFMPVKPVRGHAVPKNSRILGITWRPYQGVCKLVQWVFLQAS